jgi:hypothetical protein
MNATAEINTLWEQFRDAIDATYKAQSPANDTSAVLRDYARDISWTDALKTLIQTEIANERQHRRNRPAPKGFSAYTAAKLLLMTNVVTGAQLTNLPPVTDFLVYRKTAVEAQVLGFLVKSKLTPEWEKQVQALDYSVLMKAWAYDATNPMGL